MAKDEAPLWRTTEQSYLDHNLVAEGVEVSYTPPEGGQVAENLYPVNEAAQAWINAQVDAHPAKQAPKVKAPKEPKEPKEPKAPKGGKEPAPEPEGEGDGTDDSEDDDAVA